MCSYNLVVCMELTELLLSKKIKNFNVLPEELMYF